MCAARADGLTRQFVTTDSDLRARSGERVRVTRVIRRPDADHDFEVLPMFRVAFADGFETEAWRDELHPLPRRMKR